MTNLCTPTSSPPTLPNLPSTSLYCLVPNTLNQSSLSRSVQTCCASNPQQQLGGCDFCVIATATDWSDSTEDNDMGDIWETCLKYKVREFGGSNASVVASSCHLPELPEGESGGVRVFGTGGGAWGVWGLVVGLVVGVGLVEGVVV